MSEKQGLIKQPPRAAHYSTAKEWYEAMTCVIKRGMHSIKEQGPHRYDDLYDVAKAYRYIGSKNELIKFLNDTQPPPDYHWIYNLYLCGGARHECPIAYWPEDELKRMNQGKYKKKK